MWDFFWALQQAIRVLSLLAGADGPVGHFYTYPGRFCQIGRKKISEFFFGPKHGAGDFSGFDATLSPKNTPPWCFGYQTTVLHRHFYSKAAGIGSYRPAKAGPINLELK